MRTFIISDTHFGHANIIKYCSRPFADADQMDAEMISRWNNTVAKEDLVWHLGDFCLGREKRITHYLSQLNGRINLILGNHDQFSQRKYISLGFNKVYDRPVIINERFILSHEPLPMPLPSLSVHFINLYGHVHDNADYSTFTRNRACLCVERHDYTPVLLNNILSKFN